MRYFITVQRIEYREHTFEVFASTQIKAEVKVLDELVPNHDFRQNQVISAKEEITSVEKKD